MTEPQLERWATRGASDAQSLVLRDHCWAIPTASSDLHSYSMVCIPFSIHAYPRWEYLPMSHILSSHGGLEGALTAKMLLENPFCRKAFLEPSQIALGTGLAFCPSWPWHIPAATGYRSSMIISKSPHTGPCCQEMHALISQLSAYRRCSGPCPHSLPHKFGKDSPTQSRPV